MPSLPRLTLVSPPPSWMIEQHRLPAVDFESSHAGTWPFVSMAVASLARGADSGRTWRRPTPIFPIGWLERAAGQGSPGVPVNNSTM